MATSSRFSVASSLATAFQADFSVRPFASHAIKLLTFLFSHRADSAQEVTARACRRSTLHSGAVPADCPICRAASMRSIICALQATTGTSCPERVLQQHPCNQSSTDSLFREDGAKLAACDRFVKRPDGAFDARATGRLPCARNTSVPQHALFVIFQCGLVHYPRLDHFRQENFAWTKSNFQRIKVK